MEVTIVSQKNDQGILIHPLFLQLGDESADRFIHFRDETKVINHILLVALRRVETPMEADPPFVRFLGEKLRQGVQIRCIHFGRLGYRHPLIIFRTPVLRQVLLGGTILRMRGEKIEVEQKGPVHGTISEKVEGIAGVSFGDVNSFTGNFIPMTTHVRAAEVKELRSGRVGMVFSNVARPIPGGPQNTRIRVGKVLVGNPLPELVDAVACHVLPGENGRAAHIADAGGDKRIGEMHTGLRQSIDIWRVNKVTAPSPECVPPLIVGEDYHNIHPLRTAFSSVKDRRQRYYPQRNNK